MTDTGSSSWDRNVGNFFSDTLGNASLWNQLCHFSNFPSESGELAQQHSAQQCVRILIRARDTVLVTSESNPSGDLHAVNIAQEEESLTIELCDFHHVVTFARDDPTRLVLHGTSDVDRTLLLLELLHCLLEDSSASSHCS